MRFPGLAEEAERGGRADARGTAPSPLKQLPVSAGAFRRLVRAFDRWLGRRQGIFEFSTGSDCVLRIAIRPSDLDVALSDGTRIRTGERIVDLHLRNENLPQMGERGPDLVWSATMRQRMRASFAQLAAWLEAQPEHDAVAIRARTPFVSRGNGRAMQRISAGYGFEPVPRAGSGGALGRLHEFGENILIWALVRAYNPGGLKAKRFMRRRHDFWISRRRFLDHYGGTAPAHRPANPTGRRG